MECTQAGEHFADHVAGTVDDSVRPEFEEHIKHCASCRDEAEALSHVWSKLGAVPLEPPDIERMRRRFDEVGSADSISSPPFPPRPTGSSLRLTVVAAVVLAIALVATWRSSFVDRAGIVDGNRVTVRGTVKRAGSWEPIAYVRISLHGPADSKEERFKATTDSDGRFAIHDVPPGPYSLKARRDGYFAPTAPGASNPEAAVTIPVTVPQQGPETDVQLVLAPGAIIGGRIHDADGQPISDATVQALRVTYENGLPVLQETFTHTTGTRGEFQSSRMPEGEYYLGVTPQGLSVPPLLTAIQPGGHSIVVVGGKDRVGLELGVGNTPGFRIAGDVSGLNENGFAPGSQVRATQLLLLPHDRNAPDVTRGRQIGAIKLKNGTGQFEIPGIQPGSYDLFARLQVIAPAQSAVPAEKRTGAGARGLGPILSDVFFGRTLLEVHDRNVDALSIAIRPPVDVSGKIILKDSQTPRALRELKVSLQPNDAASRLPAYSRIAEEQPVNTDGSFVIPLVLPGNYRIAVTLSPAGGAYVADVRQGNKSLYDSGIDVGSESPKGIEVIVKGGGGSIQGKTTIESKTVSAATVVLVPSKRRDNLNLYVSTTSDSIGRFSFDGIAPGDYKIFAWQQVAYGAWQNPAFLAGYEQEGQPIKVGADPVINVRVPVISK